MILQSHSWAYIWRKPWFERIHAPQCSLQHCLQLLFTHQKTEEGEIKTSLAGFPGGAVVVNLPANAGDAGSSPGLGRSHMPRSG